MTVNTVLGPIRASELGMTLTHEHIFNDLSEAFYPGVRESSSRIATTPVDPSIAWLLREDPYASTDNCGFDETDLDTVVSEVRLFANAGGRTIVNSTTGVGRRPEALVEVAQRTGLQIVMSGGWCLSHGDEHTFTDEDIPRMTDELICEIREGVEISTGDRIRVGSIGEIGVGPQFTPAERATLVASCLAQVETGLPLFIHLPGWQRRGHEVLDVVESHGVDLSSVVLCHMDPSGKDTFYQRELAARGAWIEFDMIGMQFNFPGEGQSPSVEDSVFAVAGLIEDGFADQLLLSQDMFLKGMWTVNGGNGFAYVPVAFLPRLIDQGVDQATVTGLLTENPARLFVAAANCAGGH